MFGTKSNGYTGGMARMLVILAAALVAAAPAAGTAHPSLSLVRAQPLTVRGTGFLARERVVVRTGQVRLAVRTSTAGRFVAAFETTDRCSAVRVVAVGASGDQAVLRLPPIECPPS